MRTILVSCALILAHVALAGAQFPDAVRSGARVRVWLPEQHRQMDGPWRRQLVRGVVQSVAGDTLSLHLPGTIGLVAIPRESMRRLDVSQGSARIPSMLERAAGGAIGGAISAVIINETWPGGRYYHRTWRAAGAGASWGAIAGAVVGFVLPHERWRRLRI